MGLAEQFRGDIHADTLAKETAAPDIKPTLASQFTAAPLADAVGRSLNAAQQTTPEEKLESIKLSEQTGIPLDMVERNKQEIIAQEKQKSIDPNDIVSKNPTLARWVADPNNAALASRDIGFLKALEQTVSSPFARGFFDVPRSLAKGGSTYVGSAVSGTGELIGVATRSVDRMSFGALSALDRLLLENVGEAPVDIVGSLRGAGTSVKEFGEDVGVPEPRQNVITDVAEGVGQIAAQITAHIINPATSTIGLAGQGAGIQADRVRENEQLGTPQGDTAILTGAATTLILERLGIESLLNRLPPKIKSDLLRKIADVTIAGGVEAAQELTENIAQNIITQQFVNPDHQIVDDGVWREITAAGGAGAFVRAIVNAATRGRERQNGKQEQGMLDSIVEQTEQTWLKQNAPEKLEDFIAQSKQAGADTVYLPIEDAAIYFQSEGLDINEVLVAAGIDSQDILSAQALGGDISIPLEKYVVALGEHHAKGLREHARLTPESATPKESADVQMQQQETGQIVRQFIDATENQPTGMIKEDIVSQLTAIGQDKSTAERYGELVDKAFTTIATRSGLDPMALYKKYNLTIDREGIELGDLQPEQEPTITLSQYTPEEVEFFRSMGIPTGQRPQARPALPEVVSIGPSSFKATPINATTYRETDVFGAEDLIISNYANAPYDTTNIFVADDPDLAIGQGENKGVKIKFRPGAISGAVNAKPGAGVIGGQEYKANAIARDAIDEITLPKKAKLRSLASKYLQRYFEKTSETKAAVTYSRKRAVSDVKPRSELPATENVVTVSGGVPATDWAQSTGIMGTDGKPAPIYRGSRDGTTSEVDFAATGAATGHPSAGLGVWFSSSRADASRYGTVGEYRLDLRNPKIYSIEDFPGFDSIEDARTLQQTLKAQGHDGIVIDARNVGGPVQFVAFNANSVIEATIEREPTFSQSIDVERGQIQIGKNKARITLFEKADLSTFIHESGHLFLEVMGDIAEMDGTPQSVKDDYAAALEWLGVKSRTEIKTKHHEQWARGFEAYLGEGKPPTAELAGLFSRFRAWMLSIYKTLKSLKVNLSDEVRGVFDRMLATDEEIAEASREQGEFQSREEAGMTEKQWESYQKLLVQSRAELEGELTSRAYKEAFREREAWWKERSKEVAAEVEKEANQMPVYRVWAFLTDGKTPEGQDYDGDLEIKKLDKETLLAYYDQEFLNKNLRYKKVYQQEGGLHPAIVASQFGYESAQQMLDQISGQPRKEVYIAKETKRRMLEQYGDIRTDSSLADQAIKAAHNSRRFKALEVEVEVLARVAGRQPPNLNNMRKAADRIIASKKVRELQPYLFLRAERKAARDFAELSRKGEKAQAFEAKQRQLMNGLLYDRAWKAKEEVEKIRDYANKLQKKPKQEKLAKAGGSYLQQINGILSAYQFRKLPLKQIDRQEGLRQWVEKMQSEGDITAVTEEIIVRVEQNQGTNYQNVSVEELRGVHDALRNIDHLSNLKNKLLKKGEQRDKDEARAELVNQIKTSYPTRKALAASEFAKSKGEKLKETLRGMADALWRPETIIEALDGGESGPWHDYLWDMANTAREAQNALRERLGEPLAALAQKLTNKWADSLYDEFQVAGRKMTRRDIISLAMNLGNEGNRDKLMRGGYVEDGVTTQYTPEDINSAISHLTSRDWEMIQSVWDTVESLWPDVVEQQKRLSGLPPEKVQAVPFTVETSDGKVIRMKGGYFPLAYDPRFSGQGEIQAEDAAKAMLEGKYTRAATPKGHLKERTQFAAPVLLDYQAVMTRHLDDVITDLSHREFLKQAQWIITDPEIKNVMMERVGDTGYNALRGFIGHTVGADRPLTDASTKAWHRISDAVIANTAVYALGFRAVTAWGNLVVAPIQAAARVSPKYMVRGFAEFYGNLKEATALIHEMSPLMKHRARDLDASYVDVMNSLSGKASIRRQIARASMQVHRWADYLAVHGVWMGKYRQELDAGAEPQEAARLADKAIRQTQTAGAPKDLAGVERDPLFKMFRMFIGPMIIMNNRIRESVTQKGAVQTWPEALGVLTAAWFLPAVIFEYAVGRGPEDEEDPESWYLWMAAKIGMYPAMTVPLLRDVASGVEAAILGEYRQVRAAPIAEAGNAMVKAGATIWRQAQAAAEGDEVDTVRVTKDSLRAIGPIVGLPTNQLDITASFMYDVMTEEYEPESPLDYRYLLVRRPKE